MSQAVSSIGLDSARLQYLQQVMEEDVEQGKYHGAVIMVARNGVIGLKAAVGHAVLETKTPMRKDHLFSLFSTTKALTNVLVLRAIEKGQFALTTRVTGIIHHLASAAVSSA